ncbi:MAG: FecR domain-containing protein [Acidobacteriia bacterium]|nr:FecR domain-containing protein [Terriglobia bacterium]
MKRLTFKVITNSALILAFLLFATGFSWTQDLSYPPNEQSGQNGDEGYQGRVLRLSLVEGDVSLQHGPNDEWLDATINAPLLVGDRLWVGAQGRAEIEFDDGSYVRLASNSVFEVQQLDQSSNGRYTQVFLSQGLAYFNVRQSYNDTFRVTTPALAADSYNGGARFRLEVDDRDDLTVFRGEVQVNSNAGNATVRANELFSLPNGDNAQYYLGRAAGRDDWDRWNSDRDDYLARSSSYHYLPSSVNYGAYDLDHYGHWVYQNGYGYVWFPYNVDDGWVPYSYGRWAWYPSLGYSWVSYEPWGWLPYHYGGWEWFSGFGWAWCPGTSFGFFSPHRAFFFNFGTFVGWCPFSPFDRFFFGSAFFNIHTFRPRNFFNDRIVVVNNNVFNHNVITRQSMVRNREVISQVTSNNNLQLGLRPRVERVSGSEVLRPSSFANSSATRIASDTKGWTRQDGIRGTGARPGDALRSGPPFGGAGTAVGANRNAIGAGSRGNGAVINNRENMGRRGEVINPAGTAAGASSGVRGEGVNRGATQAPAIRTPYSGGSGGANGRSEIRNQGVPVPSSVTGGRSEGARPQAPAVQAPRSNDSRGTAPRQEVVRPESRPSTPSSPSRSEDKTTRTDKPKTSSSLRNEPGSQWRNYAEQNPGARNSARSSFDSNRPSYNPEGTGRIERVGPNSYKSSYNPPPVNRNDMRPSYTPPAGRTSYSAPSPRYEAPRYSAPSPVAPRYAAPSPSYSAPRQTYSAPSMPRQEFSRPNYSAPHYSAPSPSFRSAPAPRGESRSSGGGGGRASGSPRSGRR